MIVYRAAITIMVLGRFQSIVFAEFHGPRQRDIAVQLLGA